MLSRITKSRFISRPEQDGTPLFNFQPDGTAIVYMDRMLICPLECVTPEELDAISRRNHINRGLKGLAPEGYTLKNCIDKEPKQ